MRAGLADAVLDAQRVFRAVLDAMARPGTIRDLGAAAIDPPPPLDAATAAVVLALVDFETPLWLDGRAAAAPEVADYLRFHCGAPRVPAPGSARFALVVEPGAMPSLDAFDAGTDERPDLAATLVVQATALRSGGGVALAGPGIAGQARLHASGVPRRFWDARAAAHAHFPRGLDVVLTAGSLVAAIPRSTQVRLEPGEA